MGLDGFTRTLFLRTLLRTLAHTVYLSKLASKVTAALDYTTSEVGFHVLDYVQYYLDLMAANQRDQAEWQPEYNLSSYYGLSEVSPASLNSLAESFITLEGRTLFDSVLTGPWTTISQPTPTRCNGNLSTPLDHNIPTDTNKVQREPIYSLGPQYPKRHQQRATGTYLLPWTTKPSFRLRL
uniref:Sphingomyelin phosphodiesterase C-terminal domain-containing protein n=2 Tax=Timema TaxID=61471 RepID=A0A7R9G055_TIMSH|nr:unnamed protein product [Timema shepardi]CAD7570336.1 unnamed protein product [Timema californicum]